MTELCARPNGVVLVTGPTGSGKTTTLYGCLASINNIDINICTVENPTEYSLPMVNQVQVNERAGLTFATALRSLLRQDPDVIMVGEIRDRETAQICIEASLTGHQVFSTLHTNDAISAIPRLVNMGIESYLLAAAINGVLAQRLVRRVCKACKVSFDPDERTRALFDAYGIPSPSSRAARAARTAARPATPAAPACTSCSSSTTSCGTSSPPIRPLAPLRKEARARGSPRSRLRRPHQGRRGRHHRRGSRPSRGDHVQMSYAVDDTRSTDAPAPQSFSEQVRERVACS